MVDIKNPESKLHQIFSQSNSPKAFASNYLHHLWTVLQKIDPQVYEDAIQCIEASSLKGGTVYTLGNGGSAATASHMANDLGVEATNSEGKRLKVVSLVDNLAAISAIANDYGWDDIFSLQLEPILEAEDVLIAMSVSGNSKNVLQAVDMAKERGAKVIGCTGFDGGELAKKSDIHLHAPVDKGEYGPVEDVFQIFDHILYSYFKLKRHHRV